MVKVLFVHQAFPAQYKYIVPALARCSDNEVTFVTESKSRAEIPGVRRVNIEMPAVLRTNFESHEYTRFYEELIVRGEIYFKVLQDLVAKHGLRPDVVAVHLGAGIELFVRDAFPDTPILTYQEYFPPPHRELKEYPPVDLEPTQSKGRRIFVSHIVSQLAWSDWNLTPTFWQQSLFPEVFHSRFSVLHDGIDTQDLNPSKFPLESVKLSDGTVLDPRDQIVTFVARNLDTVRGFPTVMRAIDRIQRRNAECRFVIVGGDGVGYGKPPPGGGSWRAFMLRELRMDQLRIHFAGQVDYSTYKRLLRLSAAHVYLTTGFALSWSLLEAMAMECAIIGSATPPVEEVIEDGANGLLADFNDYEHVADLVLRALAEPQKMQKIRRGARQTVLERYALEDILPLQMALLKDLALGQLPPPTAGLIDDRNRRLGLDRFLNK